MKLNVYNKIGTVVKTYTADTYDLMFGTVEDIADAVKIDDLKTGTDAEIMKLVAKFVLTSKDTVKELLKGIFPGITDEELRCTKVKEQALVLKQVISYTFLQLSKATEKN